MTLNSPISMLHNNRVRTLLNNMKISKNTPLAWNGIPDYTKKSKNLFSIKVIKINLKICIRNFIRFSNPSATPRSMNCKIKIKTYFLVLFPTAGYS